MKISKEKARIAAEKIVAPLTKKIKDFEKQMGIELLAEYEKHIPSEVKKCFAKNPTFFKTEYSVYVGRLKGSGVYASFGKSVPQLRAFKVESIVAAQYINELETLTENRDKAQNQIESTIINLGTIKRVSDEFPEAVPFIDIPVPNTSIAINITPVRQLACDLIPGCGDKK